MEVYIGFEGQQRTFYDPVEELRANHPTEVAGVFAAVERALGSGHYVAGFLAYEAGYAFESIFDPPADMAGFPLVHFGVFKRMEEQSPQASGRSAVLKSALSIDRGTYGENVGKIRDYIRKGDVYQITYCVKNQLTYQGEPKGLFCRLLDRQPVPYPAYVLSAEFNLLSLSPELFFKKRGENLTTKPMKGTWRKGKHFISDWYNRRRLHFDPKNRAENIMIVDLMRNDLGRIGTTVQVPRLFEVTSYTTLHQMTSTVTAHAPADITALRLFSALFPSGSVTGAPKIRAMQIIQEIEDGPRRIHTGAIGYLTPARDMFFNVAIRTLLLQGQTGEMGVGGGIVWDSTPEGEYEECQIKSSFLRSTMEEPNAV
jgi:para-aminobenzoate synthetase/4-amino-4-deoxychorismate lyase